MNDMGQHWNLLVPAVIALSMYSLIYVLPRYVAPFIVLLWLGIFSGVHLPDSEESGRLLKYVTIVIVLMLMIITPRHLIKEKPPLPPDMQRQFAADINKMGILPGDRVASFGYSFSHFWARLAGVKIVAEIPSEDVHLFWKADSQGQSDIIKAFGSTGAKAIVATLIQNTIPPGWQRIKDSDYYVYMLPE